MSQLGPGEEAGLQLAIKDIDAAGGVLGQPVTLVEGDSGDAFTSVASQTVDRMLGRKITALVGATGSAVTLSVIDKVVGAGVVQVSPGDASTQLTGYPDRGLYFRVVPPDTFEASILAHTLIRAGHRTLAVLAVRDPSASGYAAELASDFTRAGGRVLANVQYDGQSSDLSAAADQMAVSGAAVNVVIGMAETSTLIHELIRANAGPQVVPLYVTDLAPWGTLARGLTPTEASGITGMRPGGPPAPAFLTRLSQQANAPLPEIGYAAQTYDATVLIALAADVAKSVTGRDIATALPQVTTGARSCSDYSDCLALIKAGDTIAYTGQAGRVELGPTGDPMNGVVGFFRFLPDGTVSAQGEYTQGTVAAAIP